MVPNVPFSSGAAVTTTWELTTVLRRESIQCFEPGIKKKNHRPKYRTRGPGFGVRRYISDGGGVETEGHDYYSFGKLDDLV